MLSREKGVTLWRQIFSLLEADIASGRLGPGSRLATESGLAAEHGVNRHTIRRALAALEQEGLIRTEHGRGSFVREPVVDYPVKRRTRFSANLAMQNRVPRSVLLQAVEIEADQTVAGALDIRRGTPCTRIASAGHADGKCISYSNSYVSSERFPGFARVYRETGSMTKSLRRFGVKDYSRRSSRIYSRMPSPAEARSLDQDRSRPVLVTESVNVDDRGRPVEFGICLFAGERVQILVEP